MAAWSAFPWGVILRFSEPSIGTPWHAASQERTFVAATKG